MEEVLPSPGQRADGSIGDNLQNMYMSDEYEHASEDDWSICSEYVNEDENVKIPEM